MSVRIHNNTYDYTQIHIYTHDFYANINKNSWGLLKDFVCNTNSAKKGLQKPKSYISKESESMRLARSFLNKYLKMSAIDLPCITK